MTRRHARTAVVAAVVAMLSSCTDAGDRDVAATNSTSEPTAAPSASDPTVTTVTTATAPDSTTIATIADSTPPAPSDTREVQCEGFTMELPTAWGAYALVADGAVRPLGGAGALPADLDGLAIAAGLQGGSLFGVSPPSADGRASTVLVTPVGADDQPVAAEVSDALRERLAAEGVTDLLVDVVDIDGRRAARATFRQVGETGAEQEAVTVYVPGERTSFVLAFSTPLPLAEAASTFVDEILRSFRTS